MGPEAGLWGDREVADGPGMTGSRRMPRAGRPHEPQDLSGVDSGIPTLVCSMVPSCAPNMEHQAWRLARQAPSRADVSASYHTPGYCSIPVGKPRHREGKWPLRSHRADRISSIPIP